MNHDEKRRAKQPHPLMLAFMLTGAILLQAHPKATSSARALPDPVAIAKHIVRNTHSLLKERIDPYRLPDVVADAVRQDLSSHLGIPASELEITDYRRETPASSCEQPVASNDCGDKSADFWQVTIADRWHYQSDPQGKTVQLQNSDVPVSYLPDAVVNAVLATASERSGLEMSDLNLVQIEAKEWDNTCLGLNPSDRECQKANVSGWQIVVAVGDQRQVYHVDSTGNSVLFNAALSSKFDNLSAHVLPSALATIVKRDLSEKVGISLEQLQVKEYSRQTWADSCLGLLNSDAVCDRKTVEGWRIVLSDGITRWVYRADAQGKALGLETSIQEETPKTVDK